VAASRPAAPGGGASESIEDDLFDGRVGAGPSIEAPLDDVLELSHIAGPAMRREPVERRGGKSAEHSAAQFSCHAAREMLGEQGDVLGALAQWRDRNDVEGQPVEEIAAKAAALGERGQIDIGRGDDAHVYVVHLVPADALEAAIFDDAQDFFLHGERGGGDLVEEQSAAVGDLEARQAAPRGAGEGADLMPEELAVEQPFGEGGAVEFDKGLVPPRREIGKPRRD
jgi:hypothetical protein